MSVLEARVGLGRSLQTLQPVRLLPSFKTMRLMFLGGAGGVFGFLAPPETHSLGFFSPTGFKHRPTSSMRSPGG